MAGRPVLRLLFVLSLHVALTASAQDAILQPAKPQATDVPREIWDTGFVQKRPAKPSSPSRVSSRTNYRTRANEALDARAYDQAALGLTIWRLRTPAARDGDGARLLIPEKAGGAKKEYVAERIDATSSLHEGDRIRIGIEIPRQGFLYVIDRERYRNGTFGQPVLLFPTLDIAEGANDVSAGRLVEIPPQNSSIKALRLARSSAEHIGEDLLVIITPSRMENVLPTEGMQTLPIAQVEQWEKDWSVSNLQLSLVEPPETLWSIAEQKAGNSPHTLLTQSDPLPGTLVAVPHQDAKTALLVHVPLAFE